MKEKFIIQGGKELQGEIEVRGAKNSAGPVLAATLLTDEECIIDNLPKISDILNLIDILQDIGKQVEWLGDRKVRITGDGFDPNNIDFEKVSQSRVSVLLMGPLLPRVKEFKMSRPGGDKIGLRPINVHLDALKQLGAEIQEDGDFYYIKCSKLKGAEIILPEFSVTATENLLMASVLAEGTTVIKTAALEPHVQDLVLMLNNMGADIQQGAHVFTIKGVDKLKGVEHSIIPDTNEAGTFLAMGAAAGKKVIVKNVIPEHLDLFLLKLKEMGVEVKVGDSTIEVCRPDSFNPVRIQALPYPGFPTDLLPLIIPVLTQAQGKSMIHDPLYENRLNYVHQLRKMGADVEIVDPHRAFVFGKTGLRGVSIESGDIRAGASLIVAGLMAKGESKLKNIGQIDRGYEEIEKRLQNIGAEIQRICLSQK